MLLITDEDKTGSDVIKMSDFFQSHFKVCPKSTDKDARGVVEIGVGAIGIGLIVKKLWKPGMELVKGIAKVITKA